MKDMNIWLITWEGTSSDITDENRIAGVLSSRYSDSSIEKMVDFLYHRTKFNVHDMAYFANKRTKREHQSKVAGSMPGHIIWGSNPFLFARRVKEFKVEYDDNNGAEIISWVENAIYANDIEDGYKVKIIEAEKSRNITRQKYRPIVNEPNNA